jgi:hypothetical protein
MCELGLRQFDCINWPLHEIADYKLERRRELDRLRKRRKRTQNKRAKQAAVEQQTATELSGQEPSDAASEEPDAGVASEGSTPGVASGYDPVRQLAERDPRAAAVLAVLGDFYRRYMSAITEHVHDLEPFRRLDKEACRRAVHRTVKRLEAGGYVNVEPVPGLRGNELLIQRVMTNEDYLRLTAEPDCAPEYDRD